MMKNRFFRFIWVHWKGILLYVAFFTIVGSLVLFMYFGGTSFLGMEGFYRKNMMAQMGIYLFIMLVGGVIQALIFSYVQMYFMMGGGMSKMLSKDSAEKTKTDIKWDDVIGME